MDDRVAIEVIDELDDALLQLVCGVDTDVAGHGAGCFGEKPLDEVEPGTVFGGERKREAAVRLSGQPRPGLPRDVRRVIIQNDLDRSCGRVTLGGLVQAVYIDGATVKAISDVDIDHGQGGAVIPVRILVP